MSIIAWKNVIIWQKDDGEIIIKIVLKKRSGLTPQLNKSKSRFNGVNKGAKTQRRKCKKVYD